MDDTSRYWLISTCLMTSAVIALAANSFLLLVFCRQRGLRTVSNRFVINLLIINLLSSVLLTPLLLIDQSKTLISPHHANRTRLQIENLVIEEEHIFMQNNETEETLRIYDTTTLLTSSWSRLLASSPPLCATNRLIARFVATLSIFSVLLIAINQYFGVIHALRYHFYINKCRSTIAILTIWLLAMLIAIGDYFTQLDCALFATCLRGSDVTHYDYDVFYALTYVILVVVAPFIAISGVYLCISGAAHQNSERMRKSHSSNFVTDETIETNAATLPKVRSAPNFAYLTTEARVAPVSRTLSNNFMTSLRHKISNASGVFRYREETRAAKISFLVVFLVVFGYVPYGVVGVLGAWLSVPQWAGPVSLVLLVASNAVSPFLFAYRNRRVKREIGRVLGVAPKEGGVERRRSVAGGVAEPFLDAVPAVMVTHEREGGKSILKRVCDVSSSWNKKCKFMQVPESCRGGGEARGSFSSASTQISNED